MIIFRLPYLVGKPRMTQRDKWLKRAATSQYWLQCDALRAQATKHGWTVPDRLSIDFYAPMPQSWTPQKKKLMTYAPHQSKPDIDNLVKAFLDAFGEDKHVHLVYASKQWTPGIEAVIVVREYEGDRVLPNLKDL